MVESILGFFTFKSERKNQVFNQVFVTLLVDIGFMNEIIYFTFTLLFSFKADGTVF